MGVDIETYRGRIGSFRFSQGVDVVIVECCINFSRGLKILGSVAFIGILLLIAGIEANPGPSELADCTCPAPRTKIKVFGLPPNIDKEDLENLFENERKQGGGCVKQLTLFQDKRSAIIEFEVDKAVEKVLRKRPIMVKKNPVQVELFHSTHTVELTGIMTGTSKNLLKHHFDSEYGTVACLTFSSVDSETVFVTFKDSKVAKQLVLQSDRQYCNKAVFHNPELEELEEMEHEQVATSPTEITSTSEG